MPSHSPGSLARAGWLPNQHGAWAMLLTPLILGITLSGPTWAHAPLAVCWLIGYFSFNAAGLWLRSRRRPRYRAPLLVYGAVAGVAGLGALALAPGLICWVPAFVPLLAVSLWCSHRRKDRSLLNDTATVLAACLMTLVAATAGSHPDWLRQAFSALALFAYFEGTVFYVKTMLRERGNRVMLTTSISYHAVCAALSALASWWFAGFFAVATIRAAILPHHRLSPRTIGVVEIFLTLCLAALLLAAPPTG